MVSDDQIFKLNGQVLGLEMVIKAMIALQFASSVKDEAGFAKAADQVRSVSSHLQEHIDGMARAFPKGAVESLIEAEMRASVRRCFEGAEAQLTEVAQLVLAVSDPASLAKN